MASRDGATQTAGETDDTDPHLTSDCKEHLCEVVFV